MWAISKQGIENLKHHKFVPDNYTIFDDIMHKFCDFVLIFVPKVRLNQGVSPNVLTFIGFVFSMLNYPIFIYYGIDRQEVPSCIYLLLGFNLYMYQTFDGIDGRHARRIKASSPLGMLFDHGCDAYSFSMMPTLLSFVINIHNKFFFFLCIFAGNFGFYLSNWGNLHINRLRMGVGIFGLTFAQLFIISLCLISFIFGNSIWEFNLIQFEPIGFLLHSYISMIKIKYIVFALAFLKFTNIVPYYI